MTAAPTKWTGHCQCCGRFQAVVNGTMSKHGYEVRSRGQAGWFVGVCEGNHFKPIEESRVTADGIGASVRQQVVELLIRVDDLKAGRVKPLQARSGRRIAHPHDPRQMRVYEMVPFDQAPGHCQDSAISSEISEAAARARTGQRFADFLEETADRFHGMPLTAALPARRPVPIPTGERRTAPHGVLTALYQHGGTVHWESVSGVRSRMAARSWRLLPVAPACAETPPLDQA